ncbi:cytosolic factor SEC14 [Trypanosoma grayi]|uniref:cytosolic factor SEC14 n=1 Tax=Trypanosoma grayi TaxID=71804 RepID=UPI0004F485DD|nr:cytosolic factor SEC14 [Trypanosoma grayi]KEG10170.1 cytosolic factor SEC14 [Trypanosoma grayi]
MQLTTLDKNAVKEGMRVQNALGLTGTIRWVGTLERKDNPADGKGVYVGVEYDEATQSPHRCDGKLGAKHHFTCEPGKGEFIKPKHLYSEINPAVVAALRERYGEKVADWHDFQLIKFAIARNFDMPAVHLMLDNHLQWLQAFQPSHDEYFPDRIVEDYPCGYSGAADFDNNLIYCERPGNAGKCTPAEFVGRYNACIITRWHASAMEMGKKIMIESDYKYKRVCYIVDLSNVGMGMNRSLITFGRTLANLDQANYPEHLGRLFLVNCSKFFRMVWRLLSVFLDESTKKKVMFLPPGGAIKSMMKHMREEDIPDFVGGPSTAWRKNGCRVGSAEPANVFKGETIVETIQVDDIPDQLDEMTLEESFREEERKSGSSLLGSSGNGDSQENSGVNSAS